MQTDQDRRCASCGADNKQGAGFCWRCYTPFAPAAPTRGAPLMPAAPAQGALIARPSHKAPTTRNRTVRIVVGVVVALVVGAFVRHMLTPTYHVPDSLAGEVRLHDAISAKFEQTMSQTGQEHDIPLEAAVYGTDEQPDVFFVLANGRAEENADELFSEFLSGAESAGITVDRGSTVTGTHADAEYRCVPMSAQGIEASACVWREDRSVGMTLDASPDGDLTSALFAAYDETHA
jgi:hypothetical protein